MNIVVTGGSGLLGTALIEGLLAFGHEVRSFSLSQSPQVQSSHADVVHGDVRKYNDIYKALRSCDVVFHCAAMTSSAGEYDEYYSANVEGTKNVIKVCHEREIGFLIYTSIWSVIFAGSHQQGVNESVKYPDKYLSHYPATKAEAERLVIKANSRMLRTVVLRPAPLWGPGEKSFSQKLVSRAREGTFHLIGDGSNMVDFLYLENCVNAHLLALGRMAVSDALNGKIYFVTDGHPVKFAEFINKHLTAAGLPVITEKISPAMASLQAAGSGLMHRIRKHADESEITKSKILESSCAHWYSIDAARDDFSYAPIVTLEQGLEKFAAWHREYETKKAREYQGSQAGVKTDTNELPSRERGKKSPLPSKKDEKKAEPLPRRDAEKSAPSQHGAGEQPPRPKTAGAKPSQAAETAMEQVIRGYVKESDVKARIERVEEAMTREIRHRDALFQICRSFTQSISPQAILLEMLHSLNSVLKFCSGGVFLYDRATEAIHCACATGKYENEMKRQIEDPGSVPAVCIKMNEVTSIDSVAGDPRFRIISKVASIKSALYCPISQENESIGALCLWTDGGDPFTAEEIKNASFVAHEVARVFKNAELYQKINAKMHFIAALWVSTKKLTRVAASSWEVRKSIIKKVLENIRILFEVDGVMFYHHDAEKKKFMPVFFTGIFTSSSSGGETDFSVDVFAEAPSGGRMTVKHEDLILDPAEIAAFSPQEKPFQMSPVSGNTPHKGFDRFSQAGGIKSLVWHPLSGGEGIRGSLVFLSRTKKVWTDEEMQWIEIFGSVFTISIENIELSEELALSRNQHNKFVASLPEGVFSTDSRRRITAWNRCAEDMTGWSCSEALGNACSSFLKCQTPSRQVKCGQDCLVEQAIRDGEDRESSEETIFILTKYSDRMPVYLSASPLFGKKGKITGSTVIFKNISRPQ